MRIVLVFVAAIVCLISMATIVFPERWLELVRRVRISTPLRLAVFALRVVLGVLLILVADSTAYSLALKVIGIAVIAAGVMALVLGNDRVQAIVDWFAHSGPPVVRAGGIAGFLISVFLVYALI